MNPTHLVQIESNLIKVKQQIVTLAHRYHRDVSDICLLAVSKTKPVTAVKAAFDAGQIDFGENYLQDALSKIDILTDLPIVWHFIGAIQSNKTRAIAENFTWVHTLASIKHAQRLNKQRPQLLPALQVCIQVNIDNEPQKAGVSIAELPALIAEISLCPRLQLRGLMAIPAKQISFDKQLQSFENLQVIYQDLQKQGLDTLSMGMSADMAAAIAAGSTLLRVGTAIFGARD